MILVALLCYLSRAQMFNKPNSASGMKNKLNEPFIQFCSKMIMKLTNCNIPDAFLQQQFVDLKYCLKLPMAASSWVQKYFSVYSNLKLKLPNSKITYNIAICRPKILPQATNSGIIMGAKLLFSAFKFDTEPIKI